MKKTLFFVALIILPLTALEAQIRNINAMKGTWQGQWVNLYYSSTGSITVTISVNGAANSAHGDWNVGGNILGQPRAPFSNDITLTGTGFTASFNSSIWGDITGTGLYSGSYSGSAANCPNPNATNIAAVGTFNTTSITGTFSFNWYGTPITGTVSITKQNPVAAPSNPSLNENPPRTVNLSWTDNASNETGYRIERKTMPAGNWAQIGTTAANTSSYQDATVLPETQYSYRIAGYSSSTESEFSNEINITTGAPVAIEKENAIPSDFLLFQNFPNPFNPSTIIYFNLPRQSNVTISVYNALGEFTETLISKNMPSGKHSVRFNGSFRASGVYIVKMNAVSAYSGATFTDCKKMVLLK